MLQRKLLLSYFTRHHRWLVNIGSCNWLVLSGNKPMLTKIYVSIWHHKSTMSELLSLHVLPGCIVISSGETIHHLGWLYVSRYTQGNDRGGWGCEVSCGGHHRPRGKTTTGSALDGAVFDIAQILAYLVHNMSRSQLYLGFGHFGWLQSFFGQ